MTWRPSEMLWRGACTAAVAGLVGAGCAGNDQNTVDVLAASSFTDVADELEPLLEAALGVDIRFSFGSSGSFREQLAQGAPASVVITADAATMEEIEAADLVEPSVAVTRNELIIVTADTASGRSIESVADLAASTEAVVVVCTSSAPCGAATDELLAGLGLELAPASREPNVRATLSKVILGEADAAIVYRTDAASRPELRAVEIGAGNISVVGRAAARVDDPDGANIMRVLTDAAAADVFAEAGFLSP